MGNMCIVRPDPVFLDPDYILTLNDLAVLPPAGRVMVDYAG